MRRLHFAREKWWERQQEAYAQICEDLSTVYSHSIGIIGCGNPKLAIPTISRSRLSMDMSLPRRDLRNSL